MQTLVGLNVFTPVEAFQSMQVFISNLLYCVGKGCCSQVYTVQVKTGFLQLNEQFVVRLFFFFFFNVKTESKRVSLTVFVLSA